MSVNAKNANNAKSKSGQALKALAFILPNLSIFTVFMAVPVLFTLGLAFFRWDPFAGATFVGFDNFNEIFSSKEFWFYMLNTLIFMIGLPLSIIGSLMLASALSIKMRGVLAWRTIYYLPSITNGVALFLLWKVMYNKEAGLINAVLLPIVNGVRALGFADPIGMDGMPDWLKDSWAFPFTLSTIAVAALVAMVIWSFRNLPKPALIISGIIGLALVVLWGGWFKELFLFLNEGSDQFYLAKSALIFMSVWTYVGGANMILYLAALAGVPTELYEAAEIDGASRWQQFRDITWPMVAPTTFFIFIMGMIAGLQGGFEMAYLMTEGGPEGSTTTIGYHIFSKAFFEFRFGYAAAASFILFLIIMAVTLVNWKFGSEAKGY